jgi:antitoxin MazE
MKSRVRRDGDDLIVPIPRVVADAAGLEEDRRVDVRANGKQIVIESPDEDDLTLDEMLDLITDENKHDLMDWGPPVGKEVWWPQAVPDPILS